MTDDALLRSYLDTLPEPHILCDAHYRILHANPAYHARFGDGQPLTGRTCYEVSHHYTAPCEACGESCPLRDALERGRPHHVVHLHHGCGGQEYVDIELTPITDAHGQLACFIEKMNPLPAHAHTGAGLVGEADAFTRMLSRLTRVAPSDAAVLLLGESGTGKELTAQAIHAASSRAARPLVTVDCTGLPETLIESELFGHEKGAFTGAASRQVGLAEAADGGTLFLDEIGDLPLPMQAKLLRLLETGTYRRLGSTQWRRTDVRIVSATHRDLAAMVTAGTFRADLYHRLATFPLYLPALRERRCDIPLLTRGLLARHAPAMKMDADALALLATHSFPGNIRELRNVIVRACLLADGPTLDATTVHEALALGLATEAKPTPDARTLEQKLEDTSALGRKAQAQALGISERTLYRLLKQSAALTG